MPLIKSDTFPFGNLAGEDHGAGISLVCIHANPTFETEWLE
ncbi:MAG TPA: hypothetical protein VFW14_13625 [Gaiellales bacterium]|jgi:hypothetical protein|nr:hypothetical protein [Gaiellales bacterium]